MKFDRQDFIERGEDLEVALEIIDDLVKALNGYIEDDGICSSMGQGVYGKEAELANMNFLKDTQAGDYLMFDKDEI